MCQSLTIYRDFRIVLAELTDISRSLTNPISQLSLKLYLPVSRHHGHRTRPYPVKAGHIRRHNKPIDSPAASDLPPLPADEP